MKGLFVFIAICFFYCTTAFAQKKEAIQGTGLNMVHLQQQAPTVHNRIVSKARTAHLYLPKPNNPLVKVHQNTFLSQSFYHQTPLKNNFSDHNKLMNQQLLLVNSPRDLVVDRLVDAAIGRLFGLD